jgi:hypothetical protein
MLATTVALHDIQDIEGFVNRTINRANLSLKREEREELVLEGLAILYRLSEIYEPHREGHARDDSRFSGFAAMYLPRKLGDAWHRMHPEHRLVTDPDTGKRSWCYLDKPTSYEHVIGHRSDAERAAVTEDNVRARLEDFSPIPLPTRARRRDASETKNPVARAA